MVATRPRKWSVPALALAVAASALQICALRSAGLGMTGFARATAAGGSRPTALHLARLQAWYSGLWSLLGFAAAVLAVTCWVRAATAGESPPHLTLTVFLLAYVLLALLIV